jgi:hypothetical protein
MLRSAVSLCKCYTREANTQVKYGTEPTEWMNEPMVCEASRYIPIILIRSKMSRLSATKDKYMIEAGRLEAHLIPKIAELPNVVLSMN